MNNIGNKITLQVQFWALLGPFLSLFNLLAITINPTQVNHHLIPVLGLGLLLCWRLARKGLYLSLGILALTLIYNLSFSQFIDFWWFVGLTFSIALSFIITALSFEEVQASLLGILTETAGQQESISKLDKTLSETQFRFEQQKKSDEEQISSLQKLLKEHLTKSNEYKEQCEIAKRDCSAFQRDYDQLVQEVFARKNEITFLGKKIEESDELIRQLKQQIQNHELVKQELTQYKEILKSKDQEVFNLQFRLNSALEDIQKALQQTEKNLKEISKLTELNQHYVDLYQKSKEEHVQQETLIQNMSEELSQIKKENERLKLKEMEIPKATDGDALNKRLEGMCRQLREQFEEKSDILHETRKELFHTQEKLQALQYERLQQELEGVDYRDAALEKVMEELDERDQEIEGLYSLIKANFE